jgi:Tol biopolymer transport system component
MRPTGHGAGVGRFSDEVQTVDWSPDGRRLLLTMEPAGSGRDWLAIAAADNVSRRSSRIVPRGRGVSHWSLGQAVWSPDGRRIAFIAYHDERNHLTRAAVCVMNAIGERLRRIRTGPLFSADAADIDDSISWQPVPGTVPTP